MKIVKASAKIIAHTPDLEKVIEYCGRVCYKSEDRITDESAAKFIRGLRTPKADGNKHESVLEHGAVTVLFTCDRGVSHELVRHRICAFSQESTRYCNYGKDKFGNEITVIDPEPMFIERFGSGYGVAYEAWREGCLAAEKHYFRMLELDCTPQMARSVLPNSLKTEIATTANPREWLHIFRMRTAYTAHPQMREIMVPLEEQFIQLWPSIFGPLEG